MKKLLGILLFLIGAKILTIYVFDLPILVQILVKFIGIFLFIQGGLLFFNKKNQTKK
ncbi:MULTISPECIES: hypothetical protein [unclassified Lysinibacillus]|uniref:hypothetical protein n=1 Tax=unclassified Lysinibacillus TaxID=2636778 RepID=UPI00143D2D12|nr:MULTISPECIES: hypothetical protein [unclassified Lysinibacillus]